VINNTSQPILLHIVRVVWRNMLVFAHFLIVHLAVYMYFIGGIPSTMPWLLLTLPLVGLNMIWLATLVGLVATRFRDMIPIIQNVVTGLFFVTPIFWPPERLKEGPARTAFVDWNPFYHLVELVRPLLLDKHPSADSVYFTLWLAAGGCLAAILIFGRVRNRIAYWL
jgi:ABC-type polysaccharide/polyol phosphate export permease